MALKYSNAKLIDLNDWDKLVQETYGRPYSFQQQEGCQDRGLFDIRVPCETDEDEMNDEIPEKVNGEEMGVKFDVWMARDPKQPIKDQEYDWELALFWERNFYPNIYTVANDLYKKGLLPEGDYTIKIDW